MNHSQYLPNIKSLAINFFVFTILMFASMLLNSAIVFAHDDDSKNDYLSAKYENNSDYNDDDHDDDNNDNEDINVSLAFPLNSLSNNQANSIYCTLLIDDLDDDHEDNLSVYFNNHLIGTLDEFERENGKFSFSINIDYIITGNNLFELKSSHRENRAPKVLWSMLVDQNQLLNQSASSKKADLKNILISQFNIESNNVIVDSHQDVHFISEGRYFIEALLMDPNGNTSNLISDYIDANADQINTLSYQPSYALDSVTGAYTLKTSLYYINNNDILKFIDVETLIFNHESHLGPIDLDNDSLSNQVEIQMGTNPTNIDTDNDGITDNIEVGPNPQLPLDSDGDGLIDAIESLLMDSDNDTIKDQNDPSNMDPCLPSTNNAVCNNTVDTDNDSLTDTQEETIGTNPNNSDSDNDGLFDNLEVGNITNNPLDSDKDGIIDALESMINDSDNDGVSDQNDPSNNDPCIPVATNTLCTNNVNEIDSDNDGITDNIEAILGTNPMEMDTDADGIDDATEIGSNVNTPIDSDGDGLNDAVESNILDSDSDGIFDHKDMDSDGDGIPDNKEFGTSTIVVDTDNDGIPNQRDLDSDNDGITDLIEAGGIDTNLDGLLDDQTDTDGDGLSDIVDPDSNGNPLPLPDTDNDSFPDFIDTDSDADNISDLVEMGGTDANSDNLLDNAQDSNNNGLADLIDPSSAGTPLTLIDTDLDGLLDYLDSDSDADETSDLTDPDRTNPCIPSSAALACLSDADSDGDGLSTIQENTLGTNPNETDSDGDGLLDGDEIGNNPNTPLDADKDGIVDANESNSLDTDNDGNVNANDIDSDGDGIPDVVEVGQNQNTLLDTDNDGQPDSLDTDSDNDGLPDSLEGGLSGQDSDNDGIDDVFDIDNTGGIDANNDGIDDQVNAVDSDEDGLPDFRDLDSDNDGISDTAENNLIGTDIDADGIDDAIDVDQTAGTDLNNDGMDDSFSMPDTDGDNIADFRDLDADNDGSNDVIEANFVDDNKDGLVDSGQDLTHSPIDTDNDGTADYRDLDSNNDGTTDIDVIQLSQLDIDKDGRIDNTADVDRDGIPDVSDDNSSRFGEGNASPNQAPSASDIDGDGVLNTVDLDDDNDGIPDMIEGTVDTDGDSIIDSMDIDSDNDGISDIIEFGGIDSDEDGMADNFTDVNANGIDDNYDSSLPGNSPLMVIDTDGDGIPNYRDLDSDADGFSDTQEQLNDFDQDSIPDYIDKNEILRTSTQGIGANGWELLALSFLLIIMRQIAIRRKTLIAIMMVLLTTNAYANETTSAELVDKSTNPWPVERWFIGFDLGASWLDPDDENTDFNVSDDTSQGFRIEAGYDWNKYIAVEGFYLFPGSAEITHVNPAIGKLGKLKYHTFGLGIDYRPVWHEKKILPHLKLGVSTTRNSTTDDQIDYERVSDISLYFGLGASWRFRQDLAAHVELVTYDKDEMFLSVGLRKYFGSKNKPVEKIVSVDSDNDGVPDETDQCANTPHQVAVNEFGCELDDDKDTIVNRLDLCPNSKPDVKVDNDGCEINEITILRGINFETNSAKIKPDSKHILDGVADILLRYPSLKVEIAGHSDNRGDSKFNMQLSQSRAESVREYLILNGAIAENLTANGYGETKPMNDLDNEDAWMENRRVELVILENLINE